MPKPNRIAAGRFTLGALALAAASAATAQTAPKPDGVWRGSVGAAATLTSGNSSNLSASLNADAVRQTKTDKLGFYLQDVYGRSRVNGVDQTTAQIFRAGGRYDRDLNATVFAFGGFDLDKNKLAGIRWRALPSVGMGLHLIKTDTTTWDVFGGYAYNWTDNYVGPDRRANEMLLGEESIHKLSPTTTVRQKIVIYPSLKDSGEFRSVAEAGITTQVIGGWSLVANVSHRYDSLPPAGVKKSDVLFFTGLQYGWGPK